MKLPELEPHKKTLALVVACCLYIVLTISIHSINIIQSIPLRANQKLKSDELSLNTNPTEFPNSYGLKSDLVYNLTCPEKEEINRQCNGCKQAKVNYLKTNCETYTENVTDAKCISSCPGQGTYRHVTPQENLKPFCYFLTSGELECWMPLKGKIF